MTTRSRRLPGVTHSVAAAAILLFAAGCGGSAGGSATPTPGAVASGPAATAAPSSTPEGTALEVRDFTLDPVTLTFSGTSVLLNVRNAGPTVHNVTIRDDAGSVLGFTRDLREGEADAIKAKLDAGTYTLFCSLPGHESLGIKGTLTVKGS